MLERAPSLTLYARKRSVSLVVFFRIDENHSNILKLVKNYVVDISKNVIVGLYTNIVVLVLSSVLPLF